MNVASLPSIHNARLPVNYDMAKKALAECQSIDECKDWSDKAAAFASYAKQSQDDELERYAQRIKARAVRRAGELAKQMMQPQGRPGKDIANDTFSKSEIQEMSGFSKRQLETATRIASVPKEEFEARVEAPKPATLTQLAQQGIKPRPLVDHKGRDPREFNRALHFLGTFEAYAKELDRAEIDRALEALIDSERATLRGFINRIDAIHDRIMTRI